MFFRIVAFFLVGPILPRFFGLLPLAASLACFFGRPQPAQIKECRHCWLGARNEIRILSRFATAPNHVHPLLRVASRVMLGLCLSLFSGACMQSIHGATFSYENHCDCQLFEAPIVGMDDHLRSDAPQHKTRYRQREDPMET